MTTRPDKLTVESFTLQLADDSIHAFELDDDLTVKLKRGGVMQNGDSQAKLVLLLQVDGYSANELYLTHCNRSYDSAWEVLCDAITSLEAMRDQLDVMMTASERRAAERNAFMLGGDAARQGIVTSIGNGSAEKQ